MAHNIGQFTEESDLPSRSEPYQIDVWIPDNTLPNGGKKERFYVQYKMIPKSYFGQNTTVTKISYCCEPAAQYFPITFKAENPPNTQVGKNGILEYQKETLINKEEGQEDPVPDFIKNTIYLPICFSKNTTKPDQKFKQTLDFVIDM